MAKASVLFLVLYASNINCVEYTYDALAGGWFKLHQPATWTDAQIRCDSEGANLASPEISQIRDAITNYMTRQGQGSATIYTGVQADFDKGDYYSVSGVPLETMPVVVNADISVDYGSSTSCVKWATDTTEVQFDNCNAQLPFICFKKRKSVKVAGCKTNDPEYKYEARSGSCYKFHRNGLPWPEAYQKCKQEGGYLAVINNEMEHKVLLQLFAKYPDNVITGIPGYACLGFHDLKDGESWKTAKGTTLEVAGFNKWADGEPNNRNGNEQCGSLYRHGNLNDIDCIAKYPFICEKDPEIHYT